MEQPAKAHSDSRPFADCTLNKKTEAEDKKKREKKEGRQIACPLIVRKGLVGEIILGLPAVDERLHNRVPLAGPAA